MYILLELFPGTLQGKESKQEDASSYVSDGYEPGFFAYLGDNPHGQLMIDDDEREGPDRKAKQKAKKEKLKRGGRMKEKLPYTKQKTADKETLGYLGKKKGEENVSKQLSSITLQVANKRQGTTYQRKGLSGNPSILSTDSEIFRNSFVTLNNHNKA